MKTNDSNSPWTIPAPSTYPIPVISICDAGSRLDRVRKSSDRVWLDRVARDRDSQTNVRLAAERRLRKLAGLFTT